MAVAAVTVAAAAILATPSPAGASPSGWWQGGGWGQLDFHNTGSTCMGVSWIQVRWYEGQIISVTTVASWVDPGFSNTLDVGYIGTPESMYVSPKDSYSLGEGPCSPIIDPAPTPTPTS